MFTHSSGILSLWQAVYVTLIPLKLSVNGWGCAFDFVSCRKCSLLQTWQKPCGDWWFHFQERFLKLTNQLCCKLEQKSKMQIFLVKSTSPPTALYIECCYGFWDPFLSSHQKMPKTGRRLGYTCRMGSHFFSLVSSVIFDLTVCFFFFFKTLSLKTFKF